MSSPLLGSCASAPDLFSSDTQWFARSGRLFIKNVSIETPPLTPDKPVYSDDLISAEGSCPGLEPSGVPADATALTDSTAPRSRPGVVALGHTECDVARGAGAPDNVNLSADGAGRRIAIFTYSRGPRAGLYTFTNGRLSSVERNPEQEQPKAVKPRAKKKPAAT
jgi:hypothetical protein